MLWPYSGQYFDDISLFDLYLLGAREIGRHIRIVAGNDALVEAAGRAQVELDAPVAPLLAEEERVTVHFAHHCSGNAPPHSAISTPGSAATHASKSARSFDCRMASARPSG